MKEFLNFLSYTFDRREKKGTNGEVTISLLRGGVLYYTIQVAGSALFVPYDGEPRFLPTETREDFEVQDLTVLDFRGEPVEMDEESKKYVISILNK